VHEEPLILAILIGVQQAGRQLTGQARRLGERRNRQAVQFLQVRGQ
jgi:hypothetical protein